MMMPIIIVESSIINVDTSDTNLTEVLQRRIWEDDSLWEMAILVGSARIAQQSSLNDIFFVAIAARYKQLQRHEAKEKYFHVYFIVQISFE